MRPRFTNQHEKNIVDYILMADFGKWSYDHINWHKLRFLFHNRIYGANV